MPLEQPPTGGSILGRLKSAFRSRLNTGTIIDNTPEAKAYRLYMEEMDRLAEAIEKKERAVGKLVDDLPGLIQDDRAEHRTQMELNQSSRDRRLRETKQRDELAALEHQAKVSEGKRAAARAQYGHDAFTESLPLRHERLTHLFKSGALDAEIEMMMRDKDLAKVAEKTTTTAESSRAGTIEQILAELNREIELAHANQEKDEVIAALYGFRARLTAILEGEKNRSG